jgi:hypothetical protein
MAKAQRLKPALFTDHGCGLQELGYELEEGV